MSVLANKGQASTCPSLQPHTAQKVWCCASPSPAASIGLRNHWWTRLCHMMASAKGVQTPKKQSPPRRRNSALPVMRPAGTVRSWAQREVTAAWSISQVQTKLTWSPQGSRRRSNAAAAWKWSAPGGIPPLAVPWEQKSWMNLWLWIFHSVAAWWGKCSCDSVTVSLNQHWGSSAKISATAMAAILTMSVSTWPEEVSWGHSHVS